MELEIRLAGGSATTGLLLKTKVKIVSDWFNNKGIHLLWV